MSRLRRALLLDAALTVLSAPLFLLAATPLAALTGLPVGLVRGLGAFLVGWALWFGVVLRHDPAHRVHVVVVLAVNTLWVLGCAVVALGAAGALNAAGVVFVAGQATVVALLTVAQARALRPTQVQATA
ncbi:hypothetical protein [Cellulomonas sp. S1-8]|uniref:hypothetical protein n=1 Tax=Cellulomonas sp. S1-8 TaxID=2904790 RepID=UPI0022432620|nr:hypothetical protein [Cellulomonas sp. S1-8]UZN05051.1 hypothetical protein OKX07_09205 [Cellulomonas sp. S1-8]